MKEYPDLVCSLLKNEGPMKSGEIAKEMAEDKMAYVIVGQQRYPLPMFFIDTILYADERFTKDGSNRWQLTSKAAEK